VTSAARVSQRVNHGQHEQIMTPNRHPFIAAALGLGLAIAAPALAQEAAAPADPAPAAEAPPATDAAPPAPAPAAAPAPAPAPAAAGTGTAPAQPEITVTEHGDWEVGCLAGTTNCEMQQVALDQSANPVILVRLVKLPAGSEAQALMIFNTPLGTLLPPGLGFQIDGGQAAALPFEWCVQEGCIVRLGLRDPEIVAMKRGSTVKLSVTSISDPAAPVELALSLTGFTAGFDSLTVPEVAAPAPAPLQQ
jgi:invasion protein IalB